MENAQDLNAVAAELGLTFERAKKILERAAEETARDMLGSRPNKDVFVSPAAPRTVTAEELFGNVPLGLRTKHRQKYVFAPELLDNPEAFCTAQSIANARNYKVKQHLPLTAEEDAQGLIANSFVNQARTRKRHKAASKPTAG